MFSILPFAWFADPSWWNIWVILGAIAFSITVVATVVIVILDKRNPTKAALWVTVLVLLPLIGLLFYIFFGRNLRRRHTFKRKAPIDLSNVLPSYTPYIISLTDTSDLPEQLVSKQHIAKLLLNSNQAPILVGNQVTVYHHGSEAFEQLKKDLWGAQTLIHMEYYILMADKIGTEITDILIEKAKNGVDVRIIYDAVGSWGIPKSFVRKLRASGIKIFTFQKVTFPFLASRINYRNHRKIVVIDGAIAHTGGMNIADRYIEGMKKLGSWRDTHLRITGPAVGALHTVFLTDWKFVTKSTERESILPFNPKDALGNTTIQIAASGPDSQWASIMQAFFLAISKAKRYIYISSPYFVPNESILTALSTAALSGVDVKIMLPKHSDSRFVQWATRSYLQELLEADISVYHFCGGFNHSKTIVIDGELATVGSANMDIRSFEDNFEVCAFVYDPQLAESLEMAFIRDAQESQRINLEEWRKRPIVNRFKDAVARLFSPLF